MAEGVPEKFNVALVVAIVAGALTLMTSIVAGYLNNRGTLEVERQKEKAESELEQQKFKTSLILEAVKVGDKQKATDNLTFFIDAGFLDDPQGKIARLLKKNVPPVLPTSKLGGSDSSWDGGDFAGVKRFEGLNPVVLALRRNLERLAALQVKQADELAAKGNAAEALQGYRESLALSEMYSCDNADAKATREKIARLPGGQNMPPCLPKLGENAK